MNAPMQRTASDVTTQVIEMARTGGPEVLQPAERRLAAPGPGEVLLRQQAAGVSFVDTYHRTGLYPLPLPAVPGIEGAGIVAAVGPDVTAVAPGDRVAWMGHPVGGYAAARLLPAARLVKLPDDVGFDTAAAVLARGITAHMLLQQVYPVGPGTIVLVHAAAGGLGLILVQWAKRLGATVIGTVGSAAKAALAERHGLDHVILYREQDVAATARALTDGRGVDYVIDGIGGDMLRKSLDCARLFGTVASVGQAGGPVAPLDVHEIGPRRALSFVRPSVMAYSSLPEHYQPAAQAVLAMLQAGLQVEIGARYPLAAAAEAHRALEAGQTTGSVLLEM
ncbi:quinone oxidoreductase family protein [Ferrovibrio xuzhouensis]|uniref:Quinone oxidoreductase family protein n=1 Tax=Ferrovibrio xuzhouensis TaxID=1576914 RepID=A0ABV7VE63_9PROT